MSVPPLSKSIGWTRGLSEGRNQMLDLQRQLATGKKAATYGGLGSDRTQSLAMRARVSATEAFQKSIQTVNLRLDMMTQALDRFGQIGREVRSDATMPSYELTDGDRTSMQLRSENALDEALSLLRSDVAGRYLFAGRDVDNDPIASMREIMEGVPGKAGFEDVLAERKAADLGADGLGRLEMTGNNDELTLARQTENFGFTLAQIDTPAAIASNETTYAGGDDIESVTFTFDDNDLPGSGDLVRLRLGMPDGRIAHVELTAIAESELDDPADVPPGRFVVHDNDAEATRQSFEQSLQSALEETAAVELSASSAFAASDQFFNYDDDNPIRRVDIPAGGDAHDATGFRDGTDDTVQWYKGDAAPGNARDARETSVARIDDQMQVAYGARANEDALRETVQTLAVLSAETFTDIDAFDEDGELNAEGARDKQRYDAIMNRTIRSLSHQDGPSPESVYAHIAAEQHAIGKAEERHTALKATAENLLDKVESADANQVAVELLQLQTRLEASYRTTSMLSQMSLVYHMR